LEPSVCRKRKTNYFRQAYRKGPGTAQLVTFRFVPDNLLSHDDDVFGMTLFVILRTTKCHSENVIVVTQYQSRRFRKSDALTQERSTIPVMEGRPSCWGYRLLRQGTTPRAHVDDAHARRPAAAKHCHEFNPQRCNVSPTKDERTLHASGAFLRQSVPPCPTVPSNLQRPPCERSRV